MSAAVAAERLARDVVAEEVRLLPMADGGDDTVEVLLGHGFQAHALPSGAVVARRDGVVVVELARICGMAALAAPDPWGATTWPLGTALREVVAKEPRQVLLALGGSASTDGGLGMLRALRGEPPGGGLTDLVELVRSGARVELPVLEVDLTAMVDVLSPLCGPTGAAWRFGPQKGLDESSCRTADEVLATWAGLIGVDPGLPGTGAAGGTGAAAVALGAQVRSGAAVVADLVGLESAVRAADLVVTGEGRLDESTLAGKAPMIVVEAALAAGVPVRIVVGEADPRTAGILRARGVEVVTLGAPAPRETG